MFTLNTRPSRKELRHWGVALLLGTLAGGLLFHLLLDRPAFARVLWCVGVIGFVTGLWFPRLARPLYLAWMGFAWIVSYTLGLLALTCVFLLVVTPIGCVARWLGRDRLKLAWPPGPGSFWENCPHSEPARHDRQY